MDFRPVFRVPWRLVPPFEGIGFALGPCFGIMFTLELTGASPLYEVWGLILAPASSCLNTLILIAFRNSVKNLGFADYFSTVLLSIRDQT